MNSAIEYPDTGGTNPDRADTEPDDTTRFLQRGSLRATGLCGAVLLTLTVCGPPGPPGDGDFREEDGGQESIDPDGGEEEGNPPEDIAEDEDEDGEASGAAAAIDSISVDLWATEPADHAP